MKYAKIRLFLGSLAVLALAGLFAMQKIHAQTATTVDLKIDGSDTAVTLTAPANYTVTWSSTNATSCSTSGTMGSMMGTADTSTSGSRPITAQTVGSYTYTTTCDGVSDSVTVTVTAATTTVSYTGFCIVRNSNTSIPSTIPSPDLGTGYAKSNKGSVPDITTLKNDCTDTDFTTLLTSYCTTNTSQVIREVALYDANNQFYTSATASQGTAALSCPTTAPAAPSGLAATVNGTSVNLSWTDNSSNETGFKMYKTINGLWTDIGNVTTNTTSYTDTNVTSGNSYSYKVQAFSQSGNSYPLYSSVSNISTVTVSSSSSSGSSGQTSSSTTPTVDIKIDGSDTTPTYSAPATYSVAWTSTNASACTTTGTWGGVSKPTSGTWNFTGVTVLGTNIYGLTCTGTSSGTASDSVSVNIVSSTSSGGSSTSSSGSSSTTGYGICLIKDSYTSIPTLSSPSTGTGYAKMQKSGIYTISGLQSSCSSSDYQSLLQAYCQNNHNQVQQLVATYDANGSLLSNSCGASGCSMITCPTTSTTTTTSTTPTTTQITTTTTTPSTTAPSAPTNLIASSGQSNIVLTWTDTSNNETGFKIYKTLGSLWTDIGNVSANTTSFTDNNIVSGSSYSYKVQAFTQINGGYPSYSGVSNVATVTAGLAITNTQPANYALSGNITDVLGKPVANAGIRVFNPASSQDFGTISNSDGSYSINLPSGNYYVELNAFPTGRTDLLKPAAQALSFTSNSNQRVNLQFLSLASSAKIATGYVKFSDGSAVTDAQIGAYSNTTGQWITANTQNDGGFSMNLGNGTWQINFRPINYQNSLWLPATSAQNITFSTDNSSETKTVNFTAQRAQAKLIILTQDDSGLPLTDVGIVVDQNSSAQNTISTSAQFQKTDSSGTATFYLAPGTYYLRGYISSELGLMNPAEQLISIASSGNSFKLVFPRKNLQTSATVSGNVSLPDGSTAGGATIWAWSDKNGQAQTTANNSGSFSLNLSLNDTWHIGAGKIINNIPYKSSEYSINPQNSSALNIGLVPVSIIPLAKPVTVTGSAGQAILGQTETGALVAIPPSSISTAGTVSLNINPTVAASAQKNARVIGAAYDINLKDTTGKNITQLSNTIEVTLPYTDSDLSRQGATVEQMIPNYFDEQAGTWVKIPDFSLDKNKKIFIARVNHLTRFALVAPASITPPNPPSQTLAWASGPAEVSLSWQDPKINFHHSRIFRSETQSAEQTLLQDLITAGSFKDTGVTVGRTYYYYLQAVDAAGNQSALTAPVAVKASQTAETMPNSSTAASLTFKTGDLVLDNGAIFFILGPTKIAFTSMKAFKGLGYSLKNVIKGDVSGYQMDETFMLDSATKAHPWGSWIKYKGTIYYNSKEGLIGVPTLKIFQDNGGLTKYVLPANNADIKIIKNQQKLELLVPGDPRIM